MIKKALLLLYTVCYCTPAYTQVTQQQLFDDLLHLSSEAFNGRKTNSQGAFKAAQYINKRFHSLGYQSQLQPFEYRSGFFSSSMGNNVIANLTTSNALAPQLIITAHYDHLGLGGPSSKSENKKTIHYGADDNASGTAALLEIAEKIAANKKDLKRSVIFIAFGAEEQGLLGSKFFIDNAPIPLSKIKLMINMDMVGRLNTEKHVYINGAGTFPEGVAFMQNLGESLELRPVVHAGSVGGSDHVSFFKKDISVLGMHTGAHPQYHRPEDTVDLINVPGQKKVCDYIYKTIMELATTNYKMEFIPQK